uniref:5-aminolevulinate synthase presequence domain-containing protein n=1 Tax=Oreochromis aureus TaxID=47969 RepID=A0A668VJZ2_OREAU
IKILTPDPKCKLKLPTGHFTPPAVQAVSSKCPFLAAEMVQKNNRLAREARMELQEDVQEIHKKKNLKKTDHTYRVFKKMSLLVSYSRKLLNVFHTKRDVPVWCSNNYLGMSHHPKVIKAIIYAVQKHGASAGEAPNISITSNFHVDLHYELPDLPGKDAAPLFTFCFVIFFFLLFILRGCEIYSEAGNHASVIQGLSNSGLLEKSDPSTSKIIAFEAVHSMDGAVCLLEGMCNVAHKFGAITFQTFSDNCNQLFWGLYFQQQPLVDTVPCYAAGFFSTASLPPMLLAGEYIKILKSLLVPSWTRQMLISGFPVFLLLMHIIILPMESLTVGNAEKNTVVCDTMTSCHNINVQAIDYPAVGKGEELLRIAPTTDHTPQMMHYFVSVSEVGLDLRSPSLAECNFCQQLLRFER